MVQVTDIFEFVKYTLLHKQQPVPNTVLQSALEDLFYKRFLRRLPSSQEHSAADESTTAARDESMRVEVLPLGRAAYRAMLAPDTAIEVQNDLLRAQRVSVAMNVSYSFLMGTVYVSSG